MHARAPGAVRATMELTNLGRLLLPRYLFFRTANDYITSDLISGSLITTRGAVGDDVRAGAGGFADLIYVVRHGREPMCAWQAEKSLRGVQPVPPRQAERHLRGVRRVPSRQCET